MFRLMPATTPLSLQAVAKIPPILRIPVETASIIFEYACTPCPDVPILLYCEVYNLRCTKLRHINREWRTIIDTNPIFWTKLHINCWTTVQQILMHMSFIGNMAMDVTIYLDPAATQYLDGPPSPDPSYSPSSDDTSSDGSASTDPDDLSISDASEDTSSPDAFNVDEHAAMARLCLAAALPSVDRWMRVCFWTSTDVFLLAILDTLASVPGPDVQYFTFGCPSGPYDVSSCSPILSNPRAIFNGFLPLVETIQLVGVPPSFVTPHLAGLRRLVISDIPGDLRPTVSELTTALTGCPSLEQLVFTGGVVVYPSDSDVAPRFTMHSLETLTVIGSEETELSLRFLISMEAPELQSTRLNNLRPVEWASASRIRALRNIDYVSIIGPPGTPRQVQAFLSRLDHVVHADFVSTSDALRYIYVGSQLANRLTIGVFLA
ncbi:hypothetical protein DFH06DRAFT_1343338 [Mycena polygramma]|nr:hypothetical protein DFH06DRAFT_1343338 [Mycena polygramma]